jgi:hypothetical protein
MKRQLINFVFFLLLFIVSCDLEKERQQADLKQRLQEIEQQDALPSSIEFCERVDDNLNVINSRFEFNPGIVYAKFSKLKPFNTDYLYATIYIIKGKSEMLFDKGSYEVNPDWGTFAIPITFYYSGTYKVEFRKIGSVKLAEGIVTIK